MKKNVPDAFDPSCISQSILDSGLEVGDLAMGLLGDFVEVPHDHPTQMAEATAVLMEQQAPIIAEASYSYDGLLCSVDILINLANHRVALYEVKSSTGVKDIYYHDAAFQFYILSMLGYRVGSYSIKYVLPALFPDDPELDYDNLGGIHHGGEVSAAFGNMPNLTGEELESTRKQLLAYCGPDTYALVKIWEKLKEICNESNVPKMSTISVI